MPRRKKRKKNEAMRGRRRILDQKKARFWQARIRAAIEEKAHFTAAAAEVDEYFKSRHASLFSSEEVQKYFMRFEGSAAVSVPKAAQIRNALGPHLYTLNPKRTVAPKGHDQVMLGLSRALGAYINRTPREAKLARQCRRTIDDALLRGRGFMRTGFDETLGIVTSWWVSSRSVLIDPDVASWIDAEWIAIRRIAPIWRLKRDITQKWRTRDLKANYRTSEEPYEEDEDHEGEYGRRAALTNDLLEVYDVYSKMGAGQLGADFDDNARDSGNDFVKLTIAMDHEVPLFEGEWEVPLYLDKDWPIEPLDFIETLDELWPESVMSQVLPLQKAMDLLTSLELNACKMVSKFVVLGDEKLPPHAQLAVRNGRPSEFIPVEVKPGHSLRDRFMRLDMGSMPPGLQMARDFLERQFETTTGLTPTVTGGNDPEAKDRSATASRLRGEATNARLGDMRARVEEWSTNVARHEALMVRLELDAEEVESYVEPEDIGLYMVSITPSEDYQTLYGGGELAVRNKGEQSAEGALTIEAISPSEATYFDSADEALEGMLQVLVDLVALAQVDPRAYSLAVSLGESMGDDFLDPNALVVLDENEQPKLNLPEGVRVRPVTVQDVWADTSGVTPIELSRELSYEIATGSMQKFDKQKEIASAETAVQQVMPAAINSGDYDLVNAIFKRLDDAHEIPEEKRLPPLTPPPPPPPTAEGAPSA